MGDGSDTFGQMPLRYASCHRPIKTAINNIVFANSSNLIFFLKGSLFLFGPFSSKDMISDSSTECDASGLKSTSSLFFRLFASSSGALYKEILFIISPPVYQFSSSVFSNFVLFGTE
jgi:hypothetical protein